MVEYKPISSLTNDSPIEFVIPRNGDDYVDLAKTTLSLNVSIKQNVETADLAEDKKTMLANVGPVNNFMHSLFS